MTGHASAVMKTDPRYLKRLATTRAHLALGGVSLQVVDDDRGRPEYIASMGCWTKAFAELSDLEAWAVSKGLVR